MQYSGWKGRKEKRVWGMMEGLEQRMLLAGDTTLYSFAGRPTDGSAPTSGLVLAGGKLYGVTQHGGMYDDGSGSTAGQGHLGGTLYSVNVDGSGYQVLHNFGGTLSGNEADGYEPLANVVDYQGKLYGTLPFGGPGGLGAIYSINLDGSGYTLIHTFGNGNVDIHQYDGGGNPFYAPLVPVNGKLYGIATSGGRPNSEGGGNGVLFSIDPNGIGYTEVHVFDFGMNVATYDLGLVTDGKTFYGISSAGGAANAGVIYAIGVDGTNFRILHALDGAAEGGGPSDEMTLVNGNELVGVTMRGGASDQGTLFTMNTDGTGFTVRQSFSTFVNGAFPHGDLVEIDGRLFGTTSLGGAGFPTISPVGSIYSTNLDGTDLQTAYTFNGLQVNGVKDGASPYGQLVADENNIYGVTGSGGANGFGTVFSIPVSGGTSVDAPVINVTLGGVPVTSNQGSAVSFGSVVKGGNRVVKVFTVKNAGTATLTLGTPQLPTGYVLVDPLVSSLAAGASDTFSIALSTGTAGTFSGNVVIADNDSNISNNQFVLPVTGTVTGSGGGGGGGGDSVDLVVKISGKLPKSAIGGATKGVETLKVSNLGKGTAGASVVELVLSEDGTLDGGDYVVGTYHVPVLKGKKSKPVKATFTYPSSVADGKYHLLAVVDPEGLIAESNEGNNDAMTAAIAVGKPTINLTGSTGTTTAKVGKAGKLVLNLKNTGNVTATRFALPVEVVLSRDGVFDGVDEQVLLDTKLTVTVPAGKSKKVNLKLPGVSGEKGLFSIEAVLDPNGVTKDANVGDNVIQGKLRLV